MSMAETVTRDDKINWLLRPLRWAQGLCSCTAITAFGLWHDGKVNTPYLMESLILAMIVASALMIWGLARVAKVAKGRV
jgi:hypothetical protein